ncbi:hypothetical protein E4T56_gene10094 [Termitomyces sp. T112]|nr:hypothetical protein E4T56_gene10094 [Termitomyces sp. T112]
MGAGSPEIQAIYNGFLLFDQTPDLVIVGLVLFRSPSASCVIEPQPPEVALTASAYSAHSILAFKPVPNTTLSPTLTIPSLRLLWTCLDCFF